MNPPIHRATTRFPFFPTADVEDDEPFRRAGLIARLAPFAIVALLAEVSLAFQSHPRPSLALSVLSAGLLAATAASCLLRWDLWLPELDVAVPLLYLASATALSLAFRSPIDGVNIVLLIPVIWTALYHRPSHALIVVVAMFAAELIVSIPAQSVPDAVLVRRLVFMAFTAGVIALAAHQLRRRIATMLEQRQLLTADRESALAAANESLAILEMKQREARVVGELSDSLHLSLSLDEAYGVMEQGLERLFEGGALSILSPTRKLLETVVHWGSYRLRDGIFDSADCWAIRRGRAHRSDDRRLACGHLTSVEPSVLCLPMVANGETIGVLHLHDCGSTAVASTDVAESGNSMAAQIAMFISNLRMRETLRLQSIRDPLTNLFNRRYMEETLARELTRATRDNYDVGVAQIDLDHFKNLNDLYGHDYGDDILRAFGSLLMGQFRGSDIPCRYGGEEFTLILPKSSLDETERRARELQDSLQELRSALGPHALPMRQLPSLSIGVAVFPLHATSSRLLVRAADQALYMAKMTGRNKVVRALAPRPAEEDSSARLVV